MATFLAEECFELEVSLVPASRQRYCPETEVVTSHSNAGTRARNLSEDGSVISDE